MRENLFEYTPGEPTDIISMKHPKEDGPLVFRKGDKCWMTSPGSTEQSTTTEVGEVLSIGENDVKVSRKSGFGTISKEQFRKIQKIGWDLGGDPNKLRGVNTNPPKRKRFD